MNATVGRMLSATFAFRRMLLKQPVFTSVVLPAMPRAARWALRKAFFLPADLMQSLLDPNEQLVPPLSERFDGSADDYTVTGNRFVKRLIDSGYLRPGSNVLDVGCGTGRLAVAMSDYLSYGGSYEGFDIVATAINWCTNSITSRFPRFRFTLADIYNREYNPHGQLQAREYQFPYADNSFDLVILASVFTHLLVGEAEHYFAEIARVLRPGGRCFATLFLLNADSRLRQASGEASIHFKHECGVYSVVSASVPELSVAYDEQYVLSLVERNGLSVGVDGLLYGGWCGRPPLWDAESGPGDQDIVVAVKPSSTQSSAQATEFRP